jgi:membrane-bound lytic murein transglycosylase D
MLQKMVNLEKTTCNIPFVWNERVYKALYFLNRGGKGPIDKWIARADYYLPVVKKMFSDSGLPEDIAYLPLIESGFNPLAYSRKRAAGMWQFIPSTGKLYGLKKDFWVDERRDFILSTRAAVSYLKKLYNQFNDWHIAIASYNCGENSMNRALSRSSSNNYWDLKKLPKETRQYVPEFLAAIIMAKNPECKGNADAQHDTFDLDTVTLNGCVSLYAVADTLGLSYDKLHEMNPHILHWCSHPFNSVLMYLPKGTKDKFISAYSNSPSSFSVSWYKYRIKSGEALKSIARHFKTPLDAILTLNNISPKQRLSIGRDLLIPIPVNQKSSNATILAACDERTKPAGRALMVNGVKVVKYKVRNGDCLWDLAQLFRVDREDICKWNNINDATSIKAGMTLTIYKSDKDYKNAVSRQQPAPVVKQTAYDASVRRVVYYKIRKGDNLWNIAQSFKVQIDELTAMNDIDVDTTLIPGDVLKVPVSEKL